MKATHFLRLLVASALIGAGSHSAQAIEVSWGSAYFDSIFTSNGAAMPDGFGFQIGTFAGGFNPASNPTTNWQANWRPFDSSTWESAWGTVQGTETLNANGTSGNTALAGNYNFSGQQAYIWASNASNSEWALVTNNTWTFTPSNDQTAFGVTWTIPDATTVVFGGLNNVQGPGGFTATPNNGTFTLQTHTTATVPEPNGALMIGIVGTLALLRRRARR